MGAPGVGPCVTNGYSSSIQGEFPLRSSKAVKSASLLRADDVAAAARGAALTAREFTSRLHG